MLLIFFVNLYIQGGQNDMLNECKNNYKDMEELVRRFGSTESEQKRCENCPYYKYYPADGLITCELMMREED